MAKRQWGAKRICMSCGVKFYDLHRNPIACPKCGTEIEVEIARPSRRRLPTQPTPPPPSKEEDVVANAADETADGDSDDVIDDIDDDDDLVGGIDEAKSVQAES